MQVADGVSEAASAHELAFIFPAELKQEVGAVPRDAHRYRSHLLNKVKRSVPGCVFGLVDCGFFSLAFSLLPLTRDIFRALSGVDDTLSSWHSILDGCLFGNMYCNTSKRAVSSVSTIFARTLKIGTSADSALPLPSRATDKVALRELP